MTEPSLGLLTTREACQVHKEHSPRSHINHRHHIWPLGEGGPDTPRNRVIVCPTGHSNIHALLDLYRRNNGPPSSASIRRFTHQERVYAATGWECMVRGSM